jgi:hypothetical protein
VVVVRQTVAGEGFLLLENKSSEGSVMDRGQVSDSVVDGGGVSCTQDRHVAEVSDSIMDSDRVSYKRNRRMAALGF